VSARLAVFGASGRTGRLVVDLALARGYDVTALVRDPGRLDVRHPALTVATVDVSSARALEPVLSDRDAVISTLGANSNRAAGIASAAARAILAARPAVRLVAVSAVPVDATPNGEPLFVRAVVTPLLRTVLRGVYADLALMEKEIRRSAADWTIFRPPRLLDRPPTERYRRRLGGNVPNGTAVSRADLAHALLAALTDPATVRQVVGVAY
jgi:putative NADH-flavin reductase